MSQYEWSNDDLSSGGNWDSRILGSIATNLTQLRTWDQAIKELVQNADDAKATEISFSISDTGITVFNDQLMTHCEYPNEKYTACNFESKSKNDFCDVHAIKTLSSQNKKRILMQQENLELDLCLYSYLPTSPRFHPGISE